MAVKSLQAIQSDIIDNILTINPQIDIKIGSPVRDIFIDVQSFQLQTLYSILEFAGNAQSVLTATGSQLDRLAYNFSATREPAKRATTNVTIVIKNGVTNQTLIQIGDNVYTNPDQGGTVYTFLVTQTILVLPGQTQVTVPVIASDPGSASNVPAYTITQSNYDFADNVYNTEKADGGKDVESDPAFAKRIPTSVTGNYPNTYAGVVKTLFNVSNINDNYQIVTPDNPLSRGPYTVDVYLQRSIDYFGTSVTETAPANQTVYTFQKQPIYELNPINNVEVFNPITGVSTDIPQILNGVTQFIIRNNPGDVTHSYIGSTSASAQLVWRIPPPVYPYTISYNVDQTIIDSQTAYNVYNEVTADTLFKQSTPIPLWISATLSGVIAANAVSINANANTHLDNLIGNLTGNLNYNNVVFALLSDGNLTNVDITNLDTTYEIVLTGTDPLTSTLNFVVTTEDSNGNATSTSNALTNHELTPLNIYWENDAPSIIAGVTVAGRLYIGNPDKVNPNGVNLNAISNKNGVLSPDMISGVSANWQTNIELYYDSASQTAIFNFSVAPAIANPIITFNIIQPVINVSTSLEYITLAPSLVQPLVQITKPNAITSLIYATTTPDGLDPTLSQVYKNGVRLILSTDGITGDYQISPPDQNGVYMITFINQPAATDILQYGLLNPNLSISTGA